jgi:threonine dehydratase
LQLSADARMRGVIAASAGNHAQGVAYHGSLLGIPVTVVMPRFAPLIKVTNCRALGAEVVLHGEDLTEARTKAQELAAERGLTFIHPFDNAQVVAGQGTMALEILEQLPEVEAIVVPVGGGGLISGIGTVVKAKKPSVEVVGVEPENAPRSPRRSRARGRSRWRSRRRSRTASRSRRRARSTTASPNASSTSSSPSTRPRSRSRSCG